MKTKVSKLTLCDCGFPVFADHITIGHEYDVDIMTIDNGKLICGGCKKVIKCWLVQDQTGGTLPLNALDIYMSHPDTGEIGVFKGKCPHCSNGCNECDGTGYIDVTIADGEWYTRLCCKCGFKNGCLIVGGNSPIQQVPSEPPPKCVLCDGTTTWFNLDGEPILN